MSPEDREAWVRAAITRSCRAPADAVGLDEDLQSAIGLDSLGKLEVLAAIEDEFDIFLEDDALSAAATVRGFLDAIQTQLARRAGAEG